MCVWCEGPSSRHLEVLRDGSVEQVVDEHLLGRGHVVELVHPQVLVFDPDPDLQLFFIFFLGNCPGATAGCA